MKFSAFYSNYAADTQNLNRYSYVLNNPLRYTDPTGQYALQDLMDQYNGTGNGFWYHGDYYTQDANGDWNGKYFGDTHAGGGAYGGSNVGRMMPDAGPTFAG